LLGHHHHHHVYSWHATPHKLGIKFQIKLLPAMRYTHGRHKDCHKDAGRTRVKNQRRQHLSPSRIRHVGNEGNKNYTPTCRLDFSLKLTLKAARNEKLRIRHVLHMLRCKNKLQTFISSLEKQKHSGFRNGDLTNV